MICDHYRTLREHFEMIAAAVTWEFRDDDDICVRRYNRFHVDGHIPVPTVDVAVHGPSAENGGPPPHRVIGRVELDYTNGGSLQRLNVTVHGQRVHNVRGHERDAYLTFPCGPDDVRALLRAAVREPKSSTPRTRGCDPGDDFGFKRDDFGFKP